eukprot:jgi/Tetstr1/462357/TSEL_007363.t1
MVDPVAKLPRGSDHLRSDSGFGPAQRSWADTLQAHSQQLEEVRASKLKLDGDRLPAEIKYEEGLKQCSWPAASYLILGETFGTGVLGLPRAMANLGWVVGLVSVLLFGLAARYAGAMLYRVKRWCHPHVMSYGETAGATVGPRVGRAVGFFIQFNWFLLMPYYLVAGAISLTSGLGELVHLPEWKWMVIFAAPLLLLTQLKSLASISGLSGLSTLSIIAVCIIAVVTVCMGEVPASLDTSTSLLLPADSSFLSAYADVSSFIFAFQGQDMHYEIMREMKTFERYPRAVSVANAVMVLAYGGVSAAVYAKFGTSTPKFLLDAIPVGPWKIAAGMLATFHVLVAFLLVSQPLVDKLFRAIMQSKCVANRKAASTAAGDGPSDALVAHAAWFGLTTSALALALLIANSIPFFNDFQNLLGAFMGSFIVFGGPPLFYLRAYKLAGIHNLWLDALLSCTFLFLLWPFCTIVGTYMAVHGIVVEWQHHSA